MHSSLKLSSVIALLLFITLPLAAQDTRGGVKGFVSDSASGERISLANIVIVGKGVGAASDHNGFYFIGNLNAGKITLRATTLGYRTIERDVEIQQGKILSLNFQLASTPIQMQGVEQVAERHTRYDTEVSTQPIGTREIEIVPTIVEKDLFRTISILPGVVATSDVSSQFYVRGGGGDQNLIVLDGMTIYNPFHALGIFSIFDADAIKEAEILKGGFPAQWGNRLSSVINIRTREGNKNRLAGKLSASLVSGKALLEGPTPWEGSWMVAGRKSFLDNMLQKFVRTETPFDFYDLIARANHSTGENGRLSMHMLVSGDIIRPESTREPEYQWNNKAYGMTWFQLLENKYLLETSFSFSNFKGELRPRANSEISPRLSEISDAYFNGNVTYFQPTGDQFGAGFMFRFPSYHYSFTNSANYERDVQDQGSETGIWVKYKFKQFDPFSFELGVRSDIFAITSANSSDAFEPRASVSWDITPLQALKFSYSRVHQRMFTITNEDDVVSLFETWLPIPSRQPSEQADHFILGLDGNIGYVQGLSFNLQAYYKKMSNLVEYNRDKVDASDPDFVRADGKSYGAEVFLELKNPIYYGWLAYTLSFTDRSVGTFTYAPRYDRRHNINIIAGVKPAEGWDISVRWEFGSGLPFTQIMGFYDRLLFGGIFNGGGYAGEKGIPYTLLGDKNRGRLPAYHRLDFNVAKTFPLGWARIIVEGSIINVYDRQNMFYYNQTTGERINMLPFLPTVNLKIEF